MDPLAISAASGARARMEALDVLANNLANAKSPGFKADYAISSVYSPDGVSSLPDLGRSWVDFQPGAAKMTSNPTDLALTGDGFFSVQSPNGILYTRNGAFRLSPQGVLITSEGHKVRSATGGTITVNPNLDLEIDSTGAVRQGGEVLGRLEVVEFADKTQLSKVGGTYFQNDGGKAEPSTKSQVLQGRLEGSNVGVAQSAVRLVELMRQSDMLNRAVMLNQQMNQKSAQDVAKSNV